MVSVNQFNPNFRYCHLILTDKKSFRRASSFLSQRAPNLGVVNAAYFPTSKRRALKGQALKATVDEQKQLDASPFCMRFQRDANKKAEKNAEFLEKKKARLFKPTRREG